MNASIKHLLGTLPLLLLLAACGGGGGGSDTGGDGGPTDWAAGVRVSPADGATNVSINEAVTIYSDNAVIDCESITYVSFTVTAESGEQAIGEVHCSDHEASFVVAGFLPPLTKFTAQIAAPKNSNGADLCDECSWSFTTGPLPFEVQEISPAPGSTHVSYMPTLRVEFSRPVECSSVTGSTFTLLDPANTPVAGTPACDSSIVTFTPNAPLNPSAKYRATMGDVVSTSGGTAGPGSWEFTTNAAAKITAPFTGHIDNESVAAIGAYKLQGSSSSAILIDVRENGSTNVISASRYVQAFGGWQNHLSPGHVTVGQDVDATGPVDLAINKDGYAALVWKSKMRSQLYFAYYNPVTNVWTTPVVVSNEPALGTVMGFDAEVDANGNAMVVWSELNHSDAARQVFARYYQRTPATMKGIQELSAWGWPANEDPHFAFDAEGNGVIVWGKWRAIGFSDPIVYSMKVTSSDYDAATDLWGSEQEIGDGMHPDVGVDASGRAVAVWIVQREWIPAPFPPPEDVVETDVDGSGGGSGTASDGSLGGETGDPEPHIYDGVARSVRAPGNSWSTRSYVGSDSHGHASNPRIAVTPSGDAMFMWNFSPLSGGSAVKAGYMAAGSSALMPIGYVARIDPWWYPSSFTVARGHGDGAELRGPQFVLHDNGNATLVFFRHDGTRHNVYSMTYTRSSEGVDGGWSQETEIDATPVDATGPLVTVDPNGVTTTVWNQANPAQADINDFWFFRR